MRDVRLHGALAELVGSQHLRLAVDGPSDLVRCLVTQYPGAREILAGSSWRVLEGGRELEAVELLVRSERPRSLELVPVLEGAGQSGAGKIIAGIFLIGAALILGPLGLPLFGLLPELGATAALALTGLGASLAFQGIAQVLAPTPAMDYMAPEQAERRQSTLFAGRTNLLGSGHPIPLVYGTTRIGSVQISSRIVTEDVGVPPDLVSVARLEVVDLLSEGEIEGLLTDDARSILFEDTRVEEDGGTVNFPDVVWELTTGAAGDPATVWGVETLTPVNTETSNADGTHAGRLAGAVSRTISDPNTDNVRVTLQLPQLFAVSGGLVANTVTPTFEVSADGGPFHDVDLGAPTAFVDEYAPYDTASTGVYDGGAGTVKPGLPIEFSWEPHYAADPGGPVTFTFYYRPLGSGTWLTESIVRTFEEYVPGDWIPISEGGDISIPGGVIIRSETPWLAVGGLYEFKGDSSNGEPFDFPPFGPLSGVWARIGYVPFDGSPITGLATSPYERDFVIENMAQYGPAPWTIRVGKVEADQTNPSTAINPMFWARFGEGLEEEFISADTARVRVELNSDDVGSTIPTRLYDVEGILLELPSNLTPSTRTYAGVWDGTFSGTRVHYDNPAWVLWDLMRSSRYGLGLAESEIDKWSVYEAAVWCDELVPDGQGGTAPRFRFNHAFTVREDALRLVQAVASSMQAQLWWGSGKLFVTQDRPASPARIFTNANVLDGVFNYSSVARVSRSTVAKVSWRNPSLGWESDADLVDRPFAIDRYGRNETDVLAIGATNFAQARRRGRYEVLTAELEGAAVSFGVAFESALLEPGQIIETWDRHREESRYGGRVLGWTPAPTSLITLDYGPDVVSIAPYTLHVMLDDQSLHASTLTAAGGGGGGTYTGPERNFILDTALPGGRSILPGAPWIITETVRRYWRVLGLAPGGDNTFQVDAVEHDPGKQARVEDFADTGAPLLLPALPALSNPSIDAVFPVYDAAADVWFLEITSTHASSEAFWWIANVVGGQEVTTSQLPIRLPVGDHATVGATSVTSHVRSATRDGAVISAASVTVDGIPATTP